jgi:hypothetical protein
VGTLLLGHREAPRIEVLTADQYEDAGSIDRLTQMVGARSLAVYVDVTSNLGALASSVFEALGGNIPAYGGGAGALDFVPKPVVVTPQGLLQGAGVVAAFAEPVAVGVAHGWLSFSEPMVVTESEGSRVISLDWQPAFQRYQAVVQDHAQVPMNAENFQAVSARYPLMVEVEGGEGVVRDPLQALSNGSLVCAGDVPTNATVRVATGDPDTMRVAAGGARQAALSRAGVRSASVAMTINCISRALLLGSELDRELEALRVPGVPQVGALTIGEVASPGEGFLLVHNKTSVVALLIEPSR